jgi:hypothetical protein
MSAPSCLLRSASRNVLIPKNSPLGSCRRAPAPIYRTNSPSRSLATVNPGLKVPPDVWFTGSAPLRNIPPSNPDEPRKPDERKVKLGKSKQPRYLLPQTLANRSNSSPYPPRTHADFTTISSATRNPLSANYSPSLSLHAPSSPHCFRTSRILSCTMDISDSMGPYASGWKRKIGDPLRTND